MSKKISPDTIQKLANGNVVFLRRGEQVKSMRGDSTIIKEFNPYQIIIKNSDDEFALDISNITTMILRGVSTTLTPPANNKAAQKEESLNTVFEALSASYFAGGGDVIQVADVGDSRAVKTVSTWTLEASGYYYHDFVHELNTSDIFFSMVDTSTNELVIPHKVVATDSNTVRFTVFGNTKRLRIAISSGGFGYSTTEKSSRTVSAETTAVLGEYLQVDTDGGNVIVNLPDPKLVKDISIWNIGGNDVVITPGTYTVNDSTSTITLSTKYDCLTISADGSRYLKKSSI